MMRAERGDYFSLLLPEGLINTHNIEGPVAI